MEEYESDESREQIYCIVQKYEQFNNPLQYEIPLAEEYSITAILQKHYLFPMLENRYYEDDVTSELTDEYSDYYSEDDD